MNEDYFDGTDKKWYSNLAIAVQRKVEMQGETWETLLLAASYEALAQEDMEGLCNALDNLVTVAGHWRAALARRGPPANVPRCQWCKKEKEEGAVCSECAAKFGEADRVANARAWREEGWAPRVRYPKEKNK